MSKIRGSWLMGGPGEGMACIMCVTCNSYFKRPEYYYLHVRREHPARKDVSDSDLERWPHLLKLLER